jgi:hypothetical protein
MRTMGVKMVLVFFLMVGRTAVMAQYSDSYRDRQDVPGDDFSLEGALELFKQSASPEEFERKLNSSESKVNNLDLNGDREIDYIRVIDKNHGNVHAFILQAVLSSTERQDVAVIELEKLANGKAVLQITGDEDVYGIETIIEPTEEVRVNAGTTTARTVVNVWTWPSVQYVYSPYYTVWVSPWYWNHRPFWWYSWRPVTYYEYYSYWYPYRRYYAPCDVHRVTYARTIYRPYRTYSSTYYKRHETRIVHYRSNYSDRTRRYSNNRSYSNDRSDRNVYEGKRDYRTTDRTVAPVVRDRNEIPESRTMDTPTPRERKQISEWKPEVKRNETVYSNRSEVRNKQEVVERKSEPRSRSSEQVNRSARQFEAKPVERSQRSNPVPTEVNRKGNGNENRGGNGNGKSRGNGRKQ